ncbi:hypothetical protein [Halocola ammonii]
MKTIKLLSLLLVFFILASCSKDEEVNNCENPPNSENSIQGYWSQTMMANGLAGYQEFEPGEIIWTFSSNNQVTLEFNIPDSEVEQNLPLEPGTHTYTIEDGQVKFADQTSWYDYYFENGQLIIENDPEADGPRMEFEEF